MTRLHYAILGVLLTVSAVGALLGASASRVEPPIAEMLPAAGKLLLTGVTIVDTRDGGLTPNRTIFLDRGKIVSITATGSADIDPAIRTVDARGRFVVPGYLDMHAHIFEPHGNDLEGIADALGLMLANGITGFRQMAASPDLLKERGEGRLPVSGVVPEPLAMPGTMLTPLNAWSPEEAVAEVRAQHDMGADFIKVILVNEPTFFAALSEARRLHMRFAGHLPEGVDIVKAANAGFGSVEHLGAGSALLIPCSTDEPALRAAIAKNPPFEGFPFNAMHLVPFQTELMSWIMPKMIVNTTGSLGPADLKKLQHMVDTYDTEKCRKLADLFVADGTWQVPTLIRLKTSQLADAPDFNNDPDLRFMTPSEVKLWRDTERSFEERFSPEARKTLRASYMLRARLVKLFDDAGVKMMTGDDVGGAEWVIPGFALHREFDEFAAAGVPPLHVLQDATLNPAEYLGTTSTMGTVDEGKNADLVLLDENPLASVQNLHKIYAVVRAGHYFSRQELDSIEARIAAKQARLVAVH